MDLKTTIVLCAVVTIAYCQYDNQYVIDQTQYLQQIGKYDNKYRYNGSSSGSNIYPQLNTTGLYGSSFNNGSVGGQRNAPAYNGSGFDANRDFLNRTITNMPKGVCIKEVP